MDQIIIRSAVKDFVANAMADPRLELLKRAASEGDARLTIIGGTDSAPDRRTPGDLCPDAVVQS